MENKNQPLISVIVPVYKVGKYLNRCVDSILAQTYTNFECILVDDGSPDNSPVICDEYAKKDNRVRVIHKVNGGVSSARNAGLDAAKGEWVCFVDSDDWVENNYLEVMVSAAGKYKCDLVISGFKEQIHNEMFALNYYSKEEHYFKNKTEVLKEFCKLRKKSKFASLLHAPFNKLYSISLIKNIRYNTNVNMGEDYLYNLKVFDTLVSFVIIPDCPYFYRYNFDSATKVVKEKNFADNLIITDETYNFFEKNRLNKKVADDFAATMANWAAIACIKGNFDINNFDYFKKFRNLITCGALVRSINVPGRFVVLFLYKFHFNKLLIWICNHLI